MDGISEGSLTVDNYARLWTSNDTRRCRDQLITFDMLPDDVLLKIFDFHADKGVDRDTSIIEKPIIEGWITLAHVCRRWRSVIFQSPRYLDLRLLCTSKTPAETLDIWPPLPLIVDARYGASLGANNILAVLEHNHRVCQIELGCFSGSELEFYTNSAATQKPFPELTHLELNIHGPSISEPTLPDSFLGGNAPRLRSLSLAGIPFPGLPKLLLPAIHLVRLDLHYIPPSGYIPPEAMATSLSALTNLDYLGLRFECPRPRPALDSRRPPPLTRSILPSLTKIEFRGTSEYLEEILARIDAPRLDGFHITFFNEVIFDTPQLFQFISRRPALRTPEKGHIAFNSEDIVVEFQSQTQTSGYDVLSVNILCTASDWRLSSIEQVCTSSLPPLSMLEDLYIFESREYPPLWQGDVENTLWLEVLHPFAAVKNLYLCEKIAPRIAPALQELVGARTTEELPTLENIFVEGLPPSGPVQEGIGKFLTARQLSSRPIAVSRWDRNPKKFGSSDRPNGATTSSSTPGFFSGLAMRAFAPSPAEREALRALGGSTNAKFERLLSLSEVGSMPTSPALNHVPAHPFASRNPPGMPWFDIGLGPGAGRNWLQELGASLPRPNNIKFNPWGDGDGDGIEADK